MRKILQKQELNAHIMKEDILPFENEKFDALTFENVLEHIQNPNKIIKEIYRVMKPDANILISVPESKVFITTQITNNIMIKKD